MFLSSPDSDSAAAEGARKVKVTYRDRQTPVISVQEAVAQQRFLPKNMKDMIVGDAESRRFINFLSVCIHCF